MEDIMTGLTKPISATITYEEYKLLLQLERINPAISRRKMLMVGIKHLLDEVEKSHKKVE